MATSLNDLQHLYARAGFGLSPKRFMQLKRHTPTRKEAVNMLLRHAQKNDFLTAPAFKMPAAKNFKSLPKAKKEALRKKNKEALQAVHLEWIEQMSAGKNPLLERMVLFWHGHFACASKGAIEAVNQQRVLRTHALGNFRDLLKGIARDPAMIRYLNNQQNKKYAPNENFARELMELFTLGRGHYTERDIKEAARAFTGWKSTPTGEFYFNEWQHDADEKEFMGACGAWDGDDIIDIILKKEQVATFIASKVYRYFVHPTPHAGHIRTLAQAFRTSNYSIKTMMETLLLSDWFYAAEYRGAKVKSPIDVLIDLRVQLGLDFIDKVGYIHFQYALGQTLFRPPNVAGWKGHRHWIDHSSLLLRVNLIPMVLQPLLERKPARGVGKLASTIDLTPLWSIAKDTPTQESALHALAEYLLPAYHQTLNLDPIHQLAKYFDDYNQGALLYIGTLPEYQMC